ncbi:hypothetical protein HPP92_008031 [Vanilla planifolia]|uniref:Uncharacterized protein n=1 Tax=Vanilla planifolia TaxID=51239 RepID=A0A835V9Z1_VANPL|nr:hypothetical protein HPP92_008031 [Vanilla planifolia]
MSDMDKLHSYKIAATVSDLWTNGLICAFEFIRGNKRTPQEKSGSRNQPINHIDCVILRKQATGNILGNIPSKGSTENIVLDSDSLIDLNIKSPVKIEEVSSFDDCKESTKYLNQCADSHWVPIGWTRISELVQMVQMDADWSSYQIDLIESGDDVTVAEVVAPYWERPAGPTWWCHVYASHPYVVSWLKSAHWLHPAISIALRDESRLISERMKYLLYEVPVRVAGGLLFELLGQSVGDPFRDEDDIPVVLRSWQAQNFLVTAMHVKGSASSVNVLGITEVQELLLAGGSTAPKSVHEVIAHLIFRLSRWDDRILSQLKLSPHPSTPQRIRNPLKLENKLLWFASLINLPITYRDLESMFDSVNRSSLGRFCELLIKQMVERVSVDGSSEKKDGDSVSLHTSLEQRL